MARTVREGVSGRRARRAGPRAGAAAALGGDPTPPRDGTSVPYFKAAHYPSTLWPGSGGRSFLYAHAQYGPPIMFGPLLAQGRVGLDVYVDRPGGAELHYVIRQFYAAWPYTDLTWLQP